ncbi:MAG TPA: tetratricopeptide repeat protein, partial [Candidatus Coprenecus merdipullorum]|nr:tetratricopeptide repeat protein [Candidatus Coprenecus merdipullorum]
VPGSNSCAQYAWLGLGQKDKAVDFMNKVIENDPDDAGNYYDAACLYSRMGESDKALEFLRTAFEKGYRRFAHIEMDDDLGEIKHWPEYKDLILKYRKVLESEIEETKTLDGLSFITGRSLFCWDSLS